MPRQKLSQQLADNLPAVPDGKRSIEHNDPNIKGFHIRQNAGSSVGTWVYSYTNATGKRSHVNLGRTDVMPFEDARGLAVEKRLEVRAGRDPAYERLQTKRVPTLSVFYHEHFLPHAMATLKTWKRYQSNWNCEIERRFGHVQLNKIGVIDVQKMHDELVGSNRAPSTADKYVKFLSRMLTLAVEWDLIKVNPIAKLRLPQRDNKRQYILSDVEIGRLLDQLKKEFNREAALLIGLLLASGARRGEAMKAKWKHIDFKSRQWFIPPSNAKSGKGRYVPLNTYARQVLSECAPRRSGHKTDYIFESQRTGDRLREVKSQWARVRAAAGIPEEARIHDLRHTYATKIIERGVSLYIVSKLLGHSTAATTERYAHVAQGTLHAASEGFGRALLDGISTGASQLPAEDLCIIPQVAA